MTRTARTAEAMMGTWLLAAVLALFPCGLSAQDAQGPAAEISGRVLSAENESPLAGAAVILRLVPGGVFGAREGASVFRATSLVVTSDAQGRYQFGDLASGRYRITVELLGYRPAAVEVELHGRASSRVTLGLQVDPISLQPLGVSITELEPMTVETSESMEADDQRVSNIRDRQARLLESDARSLGYGDLVEAVTTGEVDIFRALQRLPGVTTRDEWTAELWTRGGSWGQTRAYFDGLPLLNPLQMGGFASGVIPESVGSVVFLPGGRSVRRGPGAAGVVDMVSRSARGDASMPVRAELSVVSARATAEKRFFGGKGGLLVAGRRSWWDLATRGVSDFADHPTGVVNYHIAGVSGNADYELGENTRIITSWLWERDYLQGNIPGAIHQSRGNWGNTVNRVTLETLLWGADFNLTIGESVYNANSYPDTGLPQDPFSDPGEVVSLDEMQVVQSHESVRAEFSNQFGGSRVGRWLAGAEFIEQSLSQSGAALPINADLLAPGLRSTTNDRVALYGEVRVEATENLSVRAGLRVESGVNVSAPAGNNWSPSVTARYQLTPNLLGSVSIGRSYQYSQAIAGAGTPFGPQFYTGHTWVLANSKTPAAESDIFTAGLEWWLGNGWLAAGTTWHRRIDGVAIPDPRPGYLHPTSLDPENPAAPFVVGVSEAHGIELGIRKVAGRTTGSMSYSFTDAGTKAAGLSFSSPTERPHVFNLTAMSRVRPNLLVGGAFQAASGVRFTRTFRQYCHDWPDEHGQCPAGKPTTYQEAPAAERGQDFASVDLMLDWTKQRDGWRWGFYLQLKNVMGWDNRHRAAYVESFCQDNQFFGAGCARPDQNIDEFEDGFPGPIPLIGFKVTF